MSDLTTTVDTYLDAYGEADGERRAKLIEQIWAADGQLIDPPLDAQGRDAIDQMAAAVQGQFPGHTFRRSTGVDAHHGFARYGWEMVAADGSVTLAGTDVMQIGADGQIVRVTGFFGEPPALES
jgi:SnoaL-like domain